ncbi:alkaline phosphatase family protein [Hazenella sp. IB182353]|uniref:alkaline phosphatase family protein n=1 Tax=Polycladospora coralii TaxID=2771432 RepID=UPI001BCB3C37|nr:alkaline phosphatase family protein [Polycladospora coralii]
MSNQAKVVVIGLDCAEPTLVFEEWIDELPHIKKIMDTGSYGRMRSSDPPITVPAWASMMTGKDPGQLGFYGFRNRNSYDYEDMRLTDSTSLVEPTVWDILGKRGYQSIILGVPPSYPPKPIKGNLISCFLTPDHSVSYTHPPELKEEITDRVGTYQFDVKNFRTEQVNELLDDIYQMTQIRFETAEYLLQHKPWDFFMMVEMGIDRIHHAFWHYMDEKHVLYTDSTYKEAIRKYYQYVDGRIGELLACIPEDAHIFIVSDHGAKRMDGGLCINEWLMREGYLKLKNKVDEPVPLTSDMIDWNKTMAWGFGGYYGRLCLNVKGREPKGIIPKRHFESIRNELISKLKQIKDEQGNLLETKVFKPQKRYKDVKRIPPDLIVYFGDLYWRSVGSVGNNTMYVYENDTGPDGANHDYHGIFISNTRPVYAKDADIGRLHLMDMAPTLLSLFKIGKRKKMRGVNIFNEPSLYARIKKRGP